MNEEIPGQMTVDECIEIASLEALVEAGWDITDGQIVRGEEDEELEQ